ncbi:MAG: acyl-CoA dehydrogenase family protein [Deltaproteobacteria bacterium]|nr:acyl-CoA dehydrogenase family protein [Deltaproteobacteria bacterium]
METTTQEMIRGGSFLWDPVSKADPFIEAEVSEEHLAFIETIKNFLRKEIFPLHDQIDAKEPGLMPKLIKKVAELGLFLFEIPEEYGGLSLPKTVGLLGAQRLSTSPSLSVSCGAHIGIGTTPITFYGSPEQRAKYLPLIATAEKISSYGLTEPGAGSDALSIKTTAKLSEDGKYYILNGAKQFITNAGFADLMITYAKVDGEHFTAFIIETKNPGVHIGAEEKKMGIKGSSTCSVTLQDCKVPVENVLGEIGKGHYIAFNTLNAGRLKLGIATGGTAKHVLIETLRYGIERKQFGTPIVEFQAMKSKIGAMATRIYALDSMAFRTVGYIDVAIATLEKNSPDYYKKAAKFLEEYTTEASALKVFGSEMLSAVVDEALQMYGGYGFIQDYQVERYYRDSRINRIFEGTNEINRMLIPAMLLRKAFKGTIPLFDAIAQATEEVASGTPKGAMGEGMLAEQIQALEQARAYVLYSTGLIAQRYGMELEKEQDLLMTLSDNITDIYALDSTVARVRKLAVLKGEATAEIPKAIAEAFATETIDRLAERNRRAVAAIFSKNELAEELKKIATFLPFVPANLTALRGKIADRLISDADWTLSPW